MSKDSMVSSFYVSTLVLSVIGAILFLFTEFAGYTAAPYFYWYSVSFESTFYNPDHAIYAPIFILVAFLFLLNAIISLKGLNIVKMKTPMSAAKLGLYSSIGILIISVVGGVAFEVILSESSASDWWLNTGFYAGLIGGVLLMMLFYFVMGKEKQTT